MVQAASSSKQEKVISSAVYNLMRRLPPNQVGKSLAGIGALIESDELKQQLFDQIDQPLEVEDDTNPVKPFLKHEYNRDGDSYRSPWSNNYFPTSPEASFFPSEQLRQMEIKANDVFAQYARLYYDEAVTSVYFNDTDTQGFNGCFLVKKEMDSGAEVKSGTWDAIHVVTCNMKDAPTVKYQVISTVMISLEMSKPNTVGEMQIHGSSSKSAIDSTTLPDNFGAGVDPDMFHIKKIGEMIEKNEFFLRETVQEQYVSKQRHITNSGRLVPEFQSRRDVVAFQDLAKRGQLLGEKAGASNADDAIR